MTGMVKENYIIVCQCRWCQRIQFAYFPDGSTGYPVANAECASCGEMMSDQKGPPLFTMS